MEWFEQLSNLDASPWIVAILICLGTLISEDLACIAAGILSAKGIIPLPMAIGASAAGIWLGDIGLYGLGWLASHWKKHWRWIDKLASPDRLERGRRLFDRFGIRWLFLSRFLPGSRLPSYLAAGAFGWSFTKFSSALAIAALLWTPLLVCSTYLLGQTALELLDLYNKFAWPVFIGLTLGLFLIYQLFIPLFSWRGRRLLKGKWLRLSRWEYWPPSLVYPPVILSLLLRKIKKRKALDFTACNPCMPSSGFAMESKGDILDAIKEPESTQVRVAEYERLEINDETRDRLSKLDSFAQRQGWPVVLKPDIGERGRGVAVVRNRKEAQDWLESQGRAACLIQEYISGVEFGLQWSKLPDEPKGRITSLARKLPQSLQGDGRSTIEELLLNDHRAVAMARHFLKQFGMRLMEIPAKGEKVILTELGTHALGAIFEDARELITPELSQAVERLGMAYEGFHFGRFDLRVPSEEHLQRGEGLVILELNGVTGEPAHIYQPSYPLIKGWSDLCAHYKLAGEIGFQNQQAGASATTPKELINLVKEHRNHLKGSDE